MQDGRRLIISSPRRLQRSDSHDRHMPTRPSTPSSSIPVSSRQHEQIRFPPSYQSLEERFPPRSRIPSARDSRSRLNAPFIYGVDELSPLEEELGNLRPWEDGKDARDAIDGTLRWVRSQHTASAQEARRRTSSRCHVGGLREPTTFDWETEADRWMQHEARRQRQARQQAQRTRLVEEEVQRIHIRIRERRHSESGRMEEARRQAQRQLKEREMSHQRPAVHPLVEAWRGYESRWNEMLSTTQSLSFRSIPWPTAVRPNDPVDLRHEDITAFLFSSLHSERQAKRERLKAALLRWHPDRFRRLLPRVVEGDRDVVEEGVNVVTRCLNDAMAREADMVPTFDSR